MAPQFLKTANGLVNGRYIVLMFVKPFSEDYEVVYRNRFGSESGEETELTSANAKDVVRFLNGEPNPY